METPKAAEATLEERARQWLELHIAIEPEAMEFYGVKLDGMLSKFARMLLEEAAQMAQDYSDEMWKLYKSAPISDPRRANPHVEGLSDGAESVAIKIRRLAGKE